MSFCGGGTDLPEYFNQYGAGCVVSSSINMYSYATLREIEEQTLNIESIDYNLNVSYKPDQLVINGEFDLVKAAAKQEGITSGIDLFLSSDAPPGCGLGSSSTMAVAILSLLKYYKSGEYTKSIELAHSAINLERNVLGVPGGWQDQFAAVYGGFNLFKFNPGGHVSAQRIAMSTNSIDELQYHSLLVFTGKTRLGKKIISDQICNYHNISESMEEMKILTHVITAHLLNGNIHEFGLCLNKAWELKKKMSSKISDQSIDSLYDIAMFYGAWGCKLLGAGGGGYLYIVAPFDKKHLIARALEGRGAEVVNFEFETMGARIWCP